LGLTSLAFLQLLQTNTSQNQQKKFPTLGRAHFECDQFERNSAILEKMSCVIIR
jgi:hypothetical protein